MTDLASVSDQRRTQVESLFALIDRRDADALADAFDPGGVQVFGNQPPLHGRDEIRDGNRAFLSSIAGLRHEITGLWDVDGTVIIRLLVHYERLDGRLVTLPAMTVFTESEAGLLQHYQVWFDVTPLFA